MAFIETADRVKLFYRDWGQGKPIVFVSSQGVSCDIWNYSFPFFLDRGFRCVAFDRRGHGRSDEPSTGYDMDTLAGDIGSVLERLELDDAVLIGHSFGGAEIIRYLGRRAKWVRRAVLLAPTAPYLTRTEDNPKGFAPEMFEMVRRVWAEDFPRWVIDITTPFFETGSSPELVRWAAGLLTQIPLHVYMQTARTVVETDLRDDLKSIAVPTLFLHGDQDTSMPVEFGRDAARLTPGSTLKIYEGAGHGAFLSRPDQVNRDILEFIGS